ncbi:MAG: hypothetical protein R2910_07955 [Gemmatimonadales bacterium]
MRTLLFAAALVAPVVAASAQTPADPTVMERSVDQSSSTNSRG